MEDQLNAPPAAARLLLRLTTPAHLLAEVAADLAEDFAQHASTRWYWRQVLLSACFWFRPQLQSSALFLSACLILPAVLLDALWIFCASSVPLKVAPTHPPMLLHLLLLAPPLLAYMARSKNRKLSI